MGIISEKLNAKINDLKAHYIVNKDIVHQGVKGGSNETELSLLVKQVIPSKYKISKGIIENSKGEQSNETDFFIYDDEILPPYIKEELAFVPLEAVRYVFEVKSTNNVNELKSTIKKFKNYISLGGKAPRVLYAFSSNSKVSELERYKKYDESFFTNPSVTVLCVSNKGYYFKDVEEKYLLEILPINDFIENVKNKENISIEINGMKINISDIKNTNLNINSSELTINGIKYSEIKYKIHRWIGLESSDNFVELTFLSGISNTLCKESFGGYLLHNNKNEHKVFSICFEDMWGNLSLTYFNRNGLGVEYENLRFNFQSGEKFSKLIFSIKK